MIRYTPADTLIYLHIPKCGGTTLHGILRDNFPVEGRYYVDPHNVSDSRCNLAKMSEENRHRIELLHGHLSYGWHEHIPRPSVYFTFVRHPVERAVSHYNYVRYRVDHDHYLREAVETQNMSIAEYVRSGVCDEMNNGQVRLIAGVEDIVQEPFGKSTLPYGINDSNLLELALCNIDEHFAFVGLQERFDESLLLLKRRLGLRHVTYRQKNVGGHHYKKKWPTEEEIEIIKSYNKLDMRLYEMMRKRWECEFDRLSFAPLRLAWHHVWHHTWSTIEQMRQQVGQIRRVLLA